MSLWARCKSLLDSAIRRGRMENELEAELEFHIGSYSADLIRSGVPRTQAERMARIEFGASGVIKEDCRQALGLRLLDETLQDLTYATRMLRKSPGFTITAVLTLALGIGLNTAIFSIVDAWVLRPLPYPNPGHLLTVWTAEPQHNGRSPSSAADLDDWRLQNTVFQEVCGWTSNLFTLLRGGEPQQISGVRVNAEFFRMLGVAPQLGRDFRAEEDQPDAAPVALLSDGLWRDAFGGDPALVGKTIRIDGQETTVLGILPAGFHLPLVGRAGIWMPLALSQAERADRHARFLNVLARLKPGIRLAQAKTNLRTVASRLEGVYPATNASRSIALSTLQEEIGRNYQEPTYFCFGLVGCVLLLACANVANLIVGRAIRRQQEMAVRLAIGAGRLRILRQLLTENLILFFLAAVLSVVFAVGGMRWTEHTLSEKIRGNLPNLGALRLDTSMLLYTFAIAAFTGLIFGFAPAVRCCRMDLNHGLRATVSRISGGGGSLKSVLVVVQVALALVVVVASGLMVKGMLRMYESDPGFHPKGLVTAQVILADARYADRKQARLFFDRVLEQIRHVPGVKVAGAAAFVPYTGSYNSVPYALQGRPVPAPIDRPAMIFDTVTPGYLEAIGMPLLSGRLLSSQDGPESEPVAVINQTMARRHWPHDDPIGQKVRFGPKLGANFTIVGVVQDTEGQTESAILRPQVFVSTHQFPARALKLIIRTEVTSTNPADLSTAIRHAVVAVDPGQAIYNISTMEDLQAEMFNPARVAGQMVTLFGGISIFLAAIGIYSVMACGVAARKREFGIRMALGAHQGDLLSMVVRQGMKLAAIGSAAGLAASLATTRFMSAILYRVSPTDLPTFALTSLLTLLVAALACYVPAREAAATNPMMALHHE